MQTTQKRRKLIQQSRLNLLCDSQNNAFFSTTYLFIFKIYSNSVSDKILKIEWDTKLHIGYLRLKLCCVKIYHSLNFVKYFSLF